MKNKLIGRTVYCISPPGFYRIAYVENEESFIIEYPNKGWKSPPGFYRIAYVENEESFIIEYPNKGWKISEEENELKYGNMLSLKKRYWYVSSCEVRLVNKTINNE